MIFYLSIQASLFLLLYSITLKSMSCGKLDDLQDLAENIFDFGEDEPRQPRRERALKKQRKPKSNPESTTIEQVDDLILEQHQHVQKPPGTHSIFVRTFGCSHNISDSEFMVGQLVEYGYKMVDNANDADLVLINSCTVVNPSQDAFISMVCKAKKIKKPLVVAGCVPQGDQWIPELSEVSAVGVTQIDRIVEVVEETLKGHKVQLMQKKELPSLDLPKIRKNKDIQIIAINAGCLGACTYCKTVFARGRLLSYTPESIISRVRAVISEGVREIWLTSQDTGAYGRDIGSNISELLVLLCEQLKNHKRIMMRIGMTNPPYMLDQLSSIAHFLNHPRVFSFIHIPIQAGHNNVLEKMNRQYTVEQFRQVADYFLEHVPTVTIATDIICGFAEQTDEEFEASLKLIDEYRFRVVNINQFYLRPGTPAANLKQLPSKIVKSRSSKLTQLFRSYEKHSYMIGRQERVWINEFQVHKGSKYLVGHTKNYTKVIIPFREELLYKQAIMKITRAMDWHIEGQIIDENPADIEIDPAYVQNMKKDIIEEKEKIKHRKEVKINKIKEKLQAQRQQAKEKNEVIHQHHHEEQEHSEKHNCKCSNGSCGCSKQTCKCSGEKESQKQQQVSTQVESEVKLVENKPIENEKKMAKEQNGIVNESKKQVQQEGIKSINDKQNSKSNTVYLTLSVVFFLLGISLMMLE